jgi:hypothetical protein
LGFANDETRGFCEAATETNLQNKPRFFQNKSNYPQAQIKRLQHCGLEDQRLGQSIEMEWT